MLLTSTNIFPHGKLGYMSELSVATKLLPLPLLPVRGGQRQTLKNNVLAQLLSCSFPLSHQFSIYLIAKEIKC